jgi:hypothetical protein
MISPEMWSPIFSGKDVNSNLLLIPNYETPIKRKGHDNNERLSRNWMNLLSLLADTRESCVQLFRQEQMN